MTGIKHSLLMLSHFVNSLKIQYLFNLQSDKYCGSKKSTMTTDQLTMKLKESLFSPGREYNLDKDWRDHEEFLKYWHNTNKK